VKDKTTFSCLVYPSLPRRLCFDCSLIIQRGPLWRSFRFRRTFCHFGGLGSYRSFWWHSFVPVLYLFVLSPKLGYLRVVSTLTLLKQLLPLGLYFLIAGVVVRCLPCWGGRSW